MRQVVIISFLLIYTHLYAQLPDEDTTKIRWISVERTKENDFLFTDTSSTSLLSLLTTANQELKKVFFLELPEIELKTRMYPTITNVASDSLQNRCKSDAFSYNDSYDNGNSFSIIMNSSFPLEESDSNDLTIWCPGDYGMLCYVYPPSTSFKIPLKDVSNIKIREEFLFNPTTKKYEFKPVGFTFYPMYDNFSAYQLWIDIDRLEKTYPEISRKCITYLRSKQYKGFQYMQN